MTSSRPMDRPPAGLSPFLRLAHLLGPDLALVAMACGAPIRPRDVAALRAARREQLGGSR